MRLEVGEPFGLGARFGMNNVLCELEDTFDIEHNLVDTPIEGCRDIFMHEGSPSLACENDLPRSLEHSHVPTFCSQPLFSLEYTYDVTNDNFELCDSIVNMSHEDNMLSMLSGNVKNFGSLGYFSRYNAALDPYCIHLVDKPRKIMWSSFFDFSFYFFMAITLRGLILFFVLILMFSPSHAYEPDAAALDKLLRALTTFNLHKPSLKDVMEWLMLSAP